MVLWTAVTELSTSVENELYLLEALAATPETTQADLAKRVGIAVGTVNWYLKRWSKAGYVQIERASRWQWRYLLTAEGLLRQRQLTREYVGTSFAFYRRIRQEAKQLLRTVIQTGSHQIALVGEGEIAEICWLTCLEMQMEVISLDPPFMTEEEIVAAQEMRLGNAPTSVSSAWQRAKEHEMHLDIPYLFVEGIHLSLRWPPEFRPEHEFRPKQER